MSGSVGSEIVARSVDLSRLLNGIDEGSVVLPDFQRDFVWSDGEIMALVATIMVGWPAGSILLMEGRPAFFNTREFTGVTRKMTEVTFVVLDGQQRLTALYYALRRSGPTVYALRLNRVTPSQPSAEDLQEALIAVPRERWERQFSIGEQAVQQLVPLYELRGASEFFEWRDRVVSAAPREDKDAFASMLADAYREFLGTVNHYAFPAVILDNDLPTEAVARIFERINRGGIALSTFDLLVAKAYTPEWNLRDKWDEALDETDLLQLYLGDDGLPVAQAIALRKFEDVRRPAVLDLDSLTIQQEWEPTVSATEAALEFIRDSGMRNPAWLPYLTLVIPLAALAREFELEGARSILEAWLWSRSLSMEYDVASSTRLASDYQMLRDALRSGQTPSFEFPRALLLGATRRRQGALWRAFMSLLLRRNARDLLTGEVLAPDSTSAEEAIVAHGLPRVASEADSSPHLRILSQLLALRKSRSAFPGEKLLLEAMRRAREDPQVEESMRTQFLPPVEQLQSVLPDPDRFFVLRRDAAVEYITGELSLLRAVDVEPEGL